MICLGSCGVLLPKSVRFIFNEMAEQRKMKRGVSREAITHDNHIRSFNQATIMLCARGQVRIRQTGDSFWQESRPPSLYGEQHGYGVD